MRSGKYASLREVLAYRNPEVVARFCKSYGISKKLGNVIFKDMIRYLWLGVHAKNLNLKGRAETLEIPVVPSMLILDEMWHTFVLHTSDYAKFSHRYFGTFLHHFPEPVLRSKKARLAANKRYQSRNLERYIQFVWDELGEDVVDRWFEDYFKQFNLISIKERQLAAARAQVLEASDKPVKKR